jgi:hypothetical protein
VRATRPGSARVSSRACGSERVLAIANFLLDRSSALLAEVKEKDRLGATPKPTRETRVLPRVREPLEIIRPGVGGIARARTRDSVSR